VRVRCIAQLVEEPSIRMREICRDPDLVYGIPYFEGGGEIA
jgi:hypothetical protein